MLFPQLLLTLLLLVVCSFAPGFLIVRRFPWSAIEKLCGSVALSLVLLWLVAWGIYLLAVPQAFFALAAACGVAAIVVAKDAARLFHAPRVQRAVAAYGLLLAWTLLVLSLIRNYSGAQWTGDWLEHFQRTLYFLHHFPTNTPVYVNYLLPARPPMMTVLAAFFLGVTQDRFEIFQLVFTFLNLLVFLPCCLAIPLVARARKISLWPLLALFAMNPAVMQNATYTWTKMLTAFFVVLAINLYLSAWRKSDSLRMAAAFASLAAGLLVHYSAGPYCVFFALHYLVVLFRARPNKVSELTAIAATSGLLLLTWFGWSIAAYGVKPTFASNTSITPQAQAQGGNLAKIAGNMLDSIVPRVAYDAQRAHVLDQPYAPAVLRDQAFLLYQTNLIFSMGLFGGPLVIWSVIATFRRRTPLTGERSFWLLLIGFSLLVGLGVVGERDYFGVAHLTLVPLELLGLTLLSARFCMRRLLALVIVAGCALDFSLGVFLHARLQHLDNAPGHTYFTGLSYGNGRFAIGAPGPESLNSAAWTNWLAKHNVALSRQWLAMGEAFRPGDASVEPAKADLRAAIAQRFREDDVLWHGWFERHGGQIEFIGDHLGASDIPSALLALAAIALLWKMTRQAPRVTVAAPAIPKSSRFRHKR